MNALFHGADGIGRVLVEVVDQHHGVKETAVDEGVEVGKDLDVMLGDMLLYFFQLTGIGVADGSHQSVVALGEQLDEAGAAAYAEDTDSHFLIHIVILLDRMGHCMFPV